MEAKADIHLKRNDLDGHVKQLIIVLLRDVGMLHNTIELFYMVYQPLCLIPGGIQWGEMSKNSTHKMCVVNSSLSLSTHIIEDHILININL